MTSAGRTVIFSIHDVAPQTLPEVAELRRMIQANAGPVPVSLLVVPRYHGADAWCPGSRRWITDAARRGDEIVLHGYEHWSRYRLDGAEFDRQMTDTAVTARLALALGRLQQLGLSADGFIAPAYAQPATLTRALRAESVGWWATRTRLYASTGTRRLWSIGLGASTAWRRATSPRAARAALRLAARTPALRLDLHPADLAHPGLRRSARELIAGVLAQQRSRNAPRRTRGRRPPDHAQLPRRPGA